MTTETTLTRYYMRFRPPGPGANPRGPINVSFTREVVAGVGRVHGFVEYDRKLTAEEIRDYELTPAPKPSSFLAWFETFLDEKDVQDRLWSIEAPDGTFHSIGMDVVIESIKNAPASEQAEIKKMLVEIDFKNGSVPHFFHYLASVLVMRHSSPKSDLRKGALLIPGAF